MRFCMSRWLLVAWMLAAPPTVVCIRQASFALYEAPPVPSASSGSSRRPLKVSSVLATITAVGAIGAGAYSGTRAYRRLGGRAPPWLMGLQWSGLENITKAVDGLSKEQEFLKSLIEKVSKDSSQKSNDILASISAENRLVKDKISGIMNRVKKAEKALREETNDLRESIKFSSETTSKYLREDIKDEVENLNKVVKGLRAEISGLVEDQHEFYVLKLKNYTDAVSRTLSSVKGEISSASTNPRAGDVTDGETRTGGAEEEDSGYEDEEDFR